jgi:hypothetical protein
MFVTILKREVIKNPDISNLHANMKAGEGSKCQRRILTPNMGEKKEYLAEQDVLSTTIPDMS